MQLKPLEIKVHKDIHKYNLGYTPDPPTDEELLFYWGVKEKGLRGNVVSYNTSKMEAFKDFSPTDYIEFAKKNCDPILPDDQEFIPRKYWPNINELIGEDLTVLYHPIWGLTRQYINETYVPHSDTLLIQDCSNKKPYIHNANYRTSLVPHYAGYCDLAVCSIELIPISYTIYYPFRIYDWAHLNETSFMTQALMDFNYDRIVSFIQRFKYKRVIFLSKPVDGTGTESDLIVRLRDTYKDTNVEFINIYEREYFDESIKRASGSWGTLKSHYHAFAKKRLYELLGLDYNNNPAAKYTPEDYIRKDVYDFNRLIDMGDNYNPPVSMEEIANRIEEGLDFQTGKPYSKKRIKYNSSPKETSPIKDPTKLYNQIEVDTSKISLESKKKILW